MNTLKRGLTVVSFALFATFAWGSRFALAIPVVSIQPPVPSPTVGSFFDVSVDVSSVTDLFAFQFDISFDPTVLSGANTVEGSFLVTGGTTFFIPGSIDNTAGTISLTANSLTGPVSGISGGGTLAVVSFSAIATGTSPLSLLNVALIDSNLADIAYSTASGNVTVVPEPSVPLLLGIGILWLASRLWPHLISDEAQPRPGDDQTPSFRGCPRGQNPESRVPSVSISGFRVPLRGPGMTS